jgi:hypothetical protein
MLVMHEEWAQKIIGWLEEIKEDSDKPLDNHWDITRSDPEASKEAVYIIAEHPGLPYRVVIRLKGNFTTLGIFTGIETAVMESTVERLKAYRNLLLFNDAWYLVKAGINGDDEEVLLKLELHLASLSREEFSDALLVLVLSMEDLIKIFGLEEQFGQAQLNHVADIINNMHTQGSSKHEIMDYLVATYDVSEETAEKSVDGILKPTQDSAKTDPEYRYHY